MTSLIHANCIDFHTGKGQLDGCLEPCEAGQPLMTVGLFTRDKNLSFLGSRKATLSVLRSELCCSIPFRHFGRMRKDNPLMLWWSREKQRMTEIDASNAASETESDLICQIGKCIWLIVSVSNSAGSSGHLLLSQPSRLRLWKYDF